MLQLDGATLDQSGRELVYDLPKPFGPGRGPAYIKIVARPAYADNQAYMQRIDAITHESRVRDLKAEQEKKATGDLDAFVKANTDNVQWVQDALFEAMAHHCVVRWETDIQSAGKAIEPTTENLVELARYRHAEIRNLRQKIQADLQDAAKFSLDAENAALKDESGN